MTCDTYWRSTFQTGSDQAYATRREDTVLQEVARRIGELPGVEGVAMGESVPWRDRSTTKMQFVAEGYQPANGEESPTGRLRYVSPQYFAVLGVPLLAGRDFTDRRSDQRRTRGDRQPERGAAAVPER